MKLKVAKPTKPTSIKSISRSWHLVDVKGQVLGRAATQIATKLTGKSKPVFVRNLDCGDYVVVVNAKAIVVTGKKLDDKEYTSYSGYPGGIRKESLTHLQERRPVEVVRRAVSGMLPKNKLRAPLLKRLYIYAGSDHPYKAQLGAN
ncbi:MAG: 50S ribosomal protein L13 [Candidatus Gottesmanbacteria bacterium GW2011_GWA1_43_11]|uniref:Large ribosomal subunit protein uL13 n=1 Tax=Candidatus Gottesmanbacteria bacterium GW2011_GWA1_43_11 TaxID=1618436 RepID=A0A0G1ENM9_9BACT|nr:MAG: 50S ribosomal protein L13 [Candidatus Gottesmanbacteria bacterium GW2011_GWA1_43_11]